MIDAKAKLQDASQAPDRGSVPILYARLQDATWSQAGGMILITLEGTDQEDAWGVLTTSLLSGENEWCYMSLFHEEVCRHLASQLHASNCNLTAEDFVDRFNQVLRTPRSVQGR